MRAKLINPSPERSFAIICDTGDEVVSVLEQFARDQGLTASRVTAIGAFESATLGYFDWERKNYEHILVTEQVEVLSQVGGLALDGIQPRLHLHAVLGRRDGSTLGGHLIEARVRPTLEVLLIDAPGHLRREHDPVSGLTLIKIDS